MRNEEYEPESGDHGILDVTALGDDPGLPFAAMYRALVDEIPAILYINGPGGDAPTYFVNRQTEEILGLPPEAWIDDTWSEHVHPDDMARVDETYERFLRDEEFGIDEYRFIKPDGEMIWLHDSMRVIRDEHGKQIFVQGIMTDITLRKRNEELLAYQALVSRRIEEIGRRFTEILLVGGDLQDLLNALAEVVAHPVVFEDPAHQLVAFASAQEVDDGELLERWELHSRLAHDSDESSGCTSVEVRLQDTDAGRLHALTDSARKDEVDVLAVDRAAAAIGLWMLSGRERANLADRARSELIADLWQGRRWSGNDVLARSKSLGGNLDHPVLFGIALKFGGDGDGQETSADLLDSALESLQLAAAEEGVSCMAAIVDSTCLGVVGLPRHEGERAIVDRLWQAVSSNLSQELGGRILSMGISKPGVADTLRRLLTDAADAAAHGAYSLKLTGRYHSADLGLRNLLARLDDGPELGHFVEDELGALLTHDAQSKSRLIPTLRAFVDNGGNKAEAARELHLERRSLYYRLERIEALLGVSLDDASVRLRTQVALHGLDVLRQRRTVSLR